MKKSIQFMMVMSLLMMSSVIMNAQKIIDTSVMEVKYQAEMRTVVGYTKVDGKQILQLGNNVHSRDGSYCVIEKLNERC